MLSRRRQQLRRFLIATKEEGLVAIQVAPGQPWRAAWVEHISNHHAICQGLGIAPLQMTPIGRVKL